MKPKAPLSTEHYTAAATASNTKLAYRKDLDRFAAWGGVIPSSSAQLCDYLSQYAHFASSLAMFTLARQSK